MRREAEILWGGLEGRPRRVVREGHRLAQAIISDEDVDLTGCQERDEALLQQTASSEVLNVISSSPGELQPVFDTILQQATRVCQANFGLMIRYEERTPHPIAFFNVPQAFVELAGRGGELSEHAPSARVAQTKQIVHVADFTKEYAYAVERHPMAVAGAEIAGIRTLLVVPMLKEGDLIGNISIYRQEVRPFTEKQIALVQNFAAQAVIAIENARLLNELRESLDRQTATADILRVIASTPEDSKHALETIADTASHMFGVANVNFRRIDGDVLRVVSSAGPTIVTLRKALPDIPLEPTDPAVRCFLDNRQIPVEDRQAVLTDERGAIAAAMRELPVRSQVFTPLSREGKAIGVMISSRALKCDPFSKTSLN